MTDTIRIGSLFSGYGGLDLGVAGALDAPSELAWVCEVDPAPSRILAHHHPDVPNLGDITAVSWADVPPVDVLTAGFPCQDLSLAGARAGLREGTRSGLWSHVVRAVDHLRPSMLIFENVRGLLSARAHSDVEPCPWCVGDDEGEPALRALGAVAGDLAGLGYDLAWCGLRAADVGAPHGRFRIFGAAWPAADPDDGGREGRPGQLGQGRRGEPADRRRWAAADAHGDHLRDEPEPVAGRRGQAVAGHPRVLGRPVPDTTGDGRHEGRPEPAGIVGGPDAPLGGPTADRGGADVCAVCGCPEDFHDEGGFCAGRCAGRCDRDRSPFPDADSSGQRPDLDEVLAGQPNTDGCSDAAVPWGPYAPAVHRWERVLGRVAPAPTELAPKGGQRLSPPFVEFMMGVPEGWVTAVPGLSRNEQLKALGNGVVPQQAEAAVRWLLQYVPASGAEGRRDAA